MSFNYSINVDGIPRPQPRPRVTKKGHAYNPSSADIWKNAVKLEMVRAGLNSKVLQGPIALNLTFFMPIPKSKIVNEFDPHTNTPDADNLAKAVMDAMSDCGVWGDDRQVYRLSVLKVYNTKPGCLIDIK